jgi:hypothetical protein
MKLRRGGVTRYARLESGLRVLHRRLRELPDREGDTENEDRINCNLEHAATFFFGANQETVSGFELIVHNFKLFNTTALMQTLCHELRRSCK